MHRSLKTIAFALPLLLLVAFVAQQEPADFRKLKELLPEKLAGVARTDASGQKTSMSGQTFSSAKGEYKADETRLNVTILDYVAMPQIVQAMAYWQNMEIDQESDDGWQKTTKIGEYPAFLQWNKDGSGSVMVVVASRFIVSADLTKATPEQFAAVQKELPLDKLAGLAQ